MDNIKLSFVVPMYNSDKYLKLCINSLLNQDIPHAEYEIICINDGSTDGTREICLEYQSRFSSFRYYEQENRGLSSARNIGLSEAQGKYIWFVDSDDEIIRNCLNEILTILFENSLDVLEIAFSQSKITHEINRKLKYENSDKFRSCTAWSKIIKKDVLLKNLIIFNEKHTYSEDYTWSLELENVIGKMKYCEFPMYFYRKNDASLTRQFNARKKMIYYSLGLLGDLNYRRINLPGINKNIIVQALIWEAFMSSYSAGEKTQLIDFLEKNGNYPYKYTLKLKHKSLINLFNYASLSLLAKKALSNLLLILFQRRKALILFIQIKDLIIKDKNIEESIFDMKEIELQYYGK